MAYSRYMWDVHRLNRDSSPSCDIELREESCTTEAESPCIYTNSRQLWSNAHWYCRCSQYGFSVSIATCPAENESIAGLWNELGLHPWKAIQKKKAHSKRVQVRYIRKEIWTLGGRSRTRVCLSSQKGDPPRGRQVTKEKPLFPLLLQVERLRESFRFTKDVS